MRSLFVITSLIISALAYGQDLLPKQAPNDRKSKPLTSIYSSGNSASKTAPVDEKMKDVDKMVLAKLIESEDSINESNAINGSSKINVHYYKVKVGDTLPAIARKVNTTVDNLCKLNNISKTTRLRPGQLLKYN